MDNTSNIKHNPSVQPKLSIGVPVYNVERYLRKCVDSLLNQDLASSEYEIILVDDGATDSCPAICDEYAAKYDNIRVVHQKNAGLSAARNAGIKAAKGEYVCFVDSDDYWEENVLGGLMAQVERDKLDVLRFDYQNVRLVESRESRVKSEYEAFRPYKRDHKLDNDYSSEVTDGVTFLNERMSSQCYAVMFILRRDLIISDGTSNPLILSSPNPSNNVLFTEGIYFEDTDWTPRMLCRAKRVASTETIVYNYLVREGSITNAVNHSKQKKILEDKIKLIGEMQRQADELAQKGRSNVWFSRMIADTIVSIISMLSVDFYGEKDAYLQRLNAMNVFPITKKSFKARLINLSPSLTIELLHLKNGK